MKDYVFTITRAVSGSVVALLLTATVVRAEFRVFTGRDGQTMVAELVSASGGEVTLKRENGRTITTKAIVFSDEDQDFIRKWQQDQQSTYVPRFRFEVNSGKSTREADDLGIDYWRQTFEFSASISNEERDFDVSGAKGSLLVLGKHVTESNQLKVLSRQDFNVDIPAGKTLKYQAKKFSSTYIDIDYSREGYKYNGYLLIVHNKDGKVIATDSTPDTFARFAAAALKLKTDEKCDRMLINPDAAGDSGSGGGSVIIK